MNTNGEYENRSLTNLNKRGVRGAVALLLLLPVAVWAGGVVTNCTETDWRAAMAGGGVVTFACDGTILLANTITNESDTTLDASGRQVTISGNQAVRVFQVNTNVSFTVLNLTIADGTSAGGSAILNLGGTVNLTGVTFRSNTATVFSYGYLSPQVNGGAILNRGGTVNASNCSFAGNSAQTATSSDCSGQPVCGGAIRNETGHVDLRSCAFVGNRASGGSSVYPSVGSSPNGDPAEGGALHNSGTLTLDLCTLAGNSASGGAGADTLSLYDGFYGSEGSGGAIYNQGTLTGDRTTLCANTATGGSGGMGGGSGLDGYAGGGGGGANGAAICNLGSLWVTRSTFASNVVTGGAGGAGRYGLSSPPIQEYGGNGGRGGNGSSGLGGVLFNSGAASLVNCTLAFNTGRGGAGGSGGNGAWGYHYGGSGGAGGNGGSASGGVDGTCNLTNCTFAWNGGNGGSGAAGGAAGGSVERPGAPGANGANGGGWGGTGVSTLVNTLTTDSFPDPKLDPLANNGGPTLTMALLPGSPAIDAGNTSLAPATDQRGVPRPFSLAADIGAFEFWPTLGASRAPSGGIDLLGFGISGQTCWLLASSNYLSWVPLATNQIGTNGTILFYDDCAPGGACRFYRLVMP